MEGYAPAAFTDAVVGALRSLGHEVAICGLDTGPYHLNSAFDRLKRYTTINVAVLRHLSDYNLVLSRGHFAHWPWSVLASLRGKPVVHIMNGFIFDASTTHKLNYVSRAITEMSYRMQFNSASDIVCVTNEIAQSISNYYPATSVHVITNGVDTNTFFPLPGDAPRRPYAIFPSSLAPWHDVETIFAAVEEPDWPEGLKIMIVGDGAQGEVVSRRAQGHPLILYKGLVGKAELATLMREASIGLCLVNALEARNINEVYPLKLFEMMASGLPVVVTDLAGQRDIARDAGVGLVIDERDPRALAAAARELFLHPARVSMGIAGAKYVAEHHNWEQGARRLTTILEAAVSGRRPANA